METFRMDFEGDESEWFGEKKTRESQNTSVSDNWNQHAIFMCNS